MFRGDLVAQAAHHVAIGADEYDSQLATEIREGSVLRYESPSNPDRVRTRRDQCALQQDVVNVTALELLGVLVHDLSGPETHRFIRLPDEHGVTVRLGEEGDGAQRCPVFVIEFAGRVDETHGGFTAIHNCYPLKFLFHRVPDRSMSMKRSICCRSSTVDHAAATSIDMAACSIFRRSEFTAFGISTVRYPLSCR